MFINDYPFLLSMRLVKRLICLNFRHLQKDKILAAFPHRAVGFSTDLSTDLVD
jgi:hypothetical protein